MAQKILGLEIEAGTIRAVVLEAAYRGFELHSSITVPIEPRIVETTGEEGEEEPDPKALYDEALAVALGKVVEELGGPPEVVVSALAGSHAASSVLTLPFVDNKRIEATLGFEVEGLLPFDIDDVVYAYQVLSRGEGKSKLLVGVAKHEDVQGLIGSLAGAALDPRVLTLPGLGAFSLASAVFEAENVGADRDLALVDIGAHRTLIAIGRGAQNERSTPTLQFHRSLEVGIGDLPSTLSRTWNMGTDEVQERLVGVHLGDGSLEAKEVAKALLPTVRQLRQTFHAAKIKEKEKIDGIRLTGLASKLPGIAPWLEKELGIPVLLVDQLPGAPDLDPAFAQAYGLALRGVGRGRGLLNLRKGDLSFQGDLGYLRGKVIRVAAFAAVILILLSFGAWTRLSAFKAEEAALDESLCEITNKVLGSCETDFNVALSKLQGAGTKAAGIPAASALEVFSVAVDELSRDVGLEVQEIDATLDALRLRGVVDSFEAVEQVEAGLKKSRCIGEVRQGRVQKNREEKIELTLDALYVCGQSTGEAG